MLKITKVAAAVALTTGLLAGCNTDLRDYEETVTPDPTPESELSGGYWEMTESSAYASGDELDLPNVYVFDGTTQKYYNDDDNYGTYTIYTSTFTEDIDNQTITFTYYDTSDVASTTELTGSYSVEDGALTISDTAIGDLSADDQSEDESVKEAVTEANQEAGVNGYVQILDTNVGGTLEDTGELRIKLADSTSVSEIASGKLTVDVIYQNHDETEQEADGSGDNAYISFYAAKTSNSNLHGEVAFENGKIKYRDASGSLTETDGTFELGDELSVEVTWEADTFSFSVNGVEYGSGLDVADGTAVTYISLRLGDNGNTTNFEFLGDNLKVYSNDSGEETLVLEENFDSYSDGYNLASTYNSSTNEATVIVEGGDDNPEEPSDVTDNFDSYSAGTQIDQANSAYVADGVDGTTTIAQVSDAQAKSGDNSLYVKDDSAEGKGVVSRAFADGAAESGSVTTSVYIPADGYVKSTYLYLGTSESGSSSKRFTEVAFGSSEIKFRNESGSQKVLAKYAQDTWVDVTLAWTPSSSDDTYDVTVSIDGTEYTSYDDDGTAVPLKAENDTGAPTLFAVYNGDTSSTGTYTYFDDLDSELF
ncbi:hypothetical protein [Vibrio agarivorans]|uniref:Dystroglycan-type cadherin-like protein n=1 Tax=Vibrio agarivorans TaxID=153622 RepID=A0ABT7Y5T8_9VIBR|nr:hypothetical protein [Vibrio agarivorans]MDN2483331.1 hypothetical protein [Vibrio agarivorans]